MIYPVINCSDNELMQAAKRINQRKLKTKQNPEVFLPHLLFGAEIMSLITVCVCFLFLHSVDVAPSCKGQATSTKTSGKDVYVKPE